MEERECMKEMFFNDLLDAAERISPEAVRNVAVAALELWKLDCAHLIGLLNSFYHRTTEAAKRDEIELAGTYLSLMQQNHDEYAHACLSWEDYQAYVRDGIERLGEMK